MLTLATRACCLAILKSQQGNIVGSVGTFYLIGTAWLAGRRGERTRLIDWSALFIGLAGAGAAIALGVYTLHNPAGVDKLLPSRHELLLRRHPTARHCWRNPNARTRRNFRKVAHHAAPVAHVLRTLLCDRLFLSGPAASFPGLPARFHIPDGTSTSAATATDLLVPPRAVQQGLQEPVVAQPGTGDSLKT
jgi:hypothetical protein